MSKHGGKIHLQRPGREVVSVCGRSNSRTAMSTRLADVTCAKCREKALAAVVK